MKNKLSQNITYWLGVVAIGLVVGVSLQFVRAWTEPSVAPPGGNIGAPVNTGNIGQYKEGTLMVASNPLLPDGSPRGNGLLVPYGNVGIGTTAPSTKLEIASDNAAVGNIGFGDYTYDMWYDGGSDGAFFFYNTGVSTGRTGFVWKNASSVDTEYLTIRNTGNVGIGTTAPAAKLDVMGSIITGNSGQPCDAAHTGMLASNRGADTNLYYCNGSTWQKLNGGEEVNRFGGIYMLGASGNPDACRYANPITGGCSCPAGYNSYQFWEFLGDSGFYENTLARMYQCVK